MQHGMLHTINVSHNWSQILVGNSNLAKHSEWDLPIAIGEGLKLSI